MHQCLACDEMRASHHKRAICDSPDQFPRCAECGADAERAIDCQQAEFGGGGFAPMQRASVALVEDRGHPALDAQNIPRRVAQLSVIPAALSLTRRN